MTFDAARTAVLCMDCQTGILSFYTGDKEEFLGRMGNVLGHARDRGMKVIYVRVGFRPGMPEISPRNAYFNAIKSDPERQKMLQGPLGEIAASIAPKEGDIVVTKHRISAFSGTDLAMILRAAEIDTLILFGIATSGVVLSTLVDAVDADFRLLVLKDCCADRNASLHDCLVNQFFPARATVVSSEEFLAAE